MDDFDAGSYWEARLGRRYDLAGVGHSSLGREYNRWLYAVRRRVFHRVISKYGLDVSGKSVLDIGSGTGFYVDRWKERNAGSITGVDITDTAVRSLAQKYPDCRFHKLDIGGELGVLESRQFDVVSIFDVLFHVVDDNRLERAISNISSLLPPGGHFVVADLFLRGEPIRAKHHVCRTNSYMLSVLERNRLQVVARAPVFVLMVEPLSTHSRFAKRLWDLTARVASSNEVAGYVVGAGLYPIELAVTRVRREGPSTEMLICRKLDA